MATISQLIIQKIKPYTDTIQNTILSSPANTENFLLKPSTRWILALLIVILNINSYNQTKQKHSSKQCIVFVNCKIYYTIIFLLLIIINSLFFYYLENNASLGLPKYSWTIISVIALLAIYNIFESTEIIEKDGLFYPSPFFRKFINISYNLILFILSSLSTLIEYYLLNINNNNKNNNNNNTKKESNLNSYILKLKILEVIIHFINLIYSIIFTTCKYNLPNTWRL